MSGSEVLEELYSNPQFENKVHHISGVSDGQGPADFVNVKSQYDGENRTTPATQAVAQHRHRDLEQVQPYSAAPTDVFTGQTSSYIQFNLPPQTGAVEDMYYEFKSTIANASGGSVDVRRLPAPLTIDRIELLLDSSSVFETIYGDALYLETLYSNNEPKFAREADAGQFGATPGNGTAGMEAEITVADGAATPQVTTRLRLLTMLQTAKICPKALSTDVVIRVYHHKHNHNKGGTAGITGTFTQPRLWIRSTVLTHSEQNRLTSMYQSSQGVHYRVIKRNTATHPISAIAAGVEHTQLNSTFRGSAAATLVYFKQQSDAGDLRSTYYPLTESRVHDSSGRTRHRLIDHDYHQAFINGEFIGSRMPSNTLPPFYLYLGSTAFLRDLTGGSASGSHIEDARVKYMLTPAAGMAGLNVNLTFISYQFCTLHIRDGVVTIEQS